MGFAARSPANLGALCITFGTPSLGFAFALARIFQRVRVYRTDKPDTVANQR